MYFWIAAVKADGLFDEFALAFAVVLFVQLFDTLLRVGIYPQRELALVFFRH